MRRIKERNEEMETTQMAARKKRDPKAEAIAKSILEAYKPKNQEEMQEAMKGIAKKYVAIYEQGFKDARAMKVPAHMEKRKEEVISKQERQFKRLKSFVEEKEK